MRKEGNQKKKEKKTIKPNAVIGTGNNPHDQPPHRQLPAQYTLPLQQKGRSFTRFWRTKAQPSLARSPHVVAAGWLGRLALLVLEEEKKKAHVTIIPRSVS